MKTITITQNDDGTIMVDDGTEAQTYRNAMQAMQAIETLLGPSESEQETVMESMRSGYEGRGGKMQMGGM